MRHSIFWLPPMPDNFIGVDVGGGGIRIRAVISGQRTKVHDRGPVPRLSGRIDTRELGARIGGLVTQMHPGGESHRVAVGLTGLPGLLDSPAELADHIHHHISTRTVIIASDSLTTHFGALGGRPGSVVSAGTGVIVLGTDHRTVWNRVDGWGYLLGDEGSGSWIGAQGLQAALRHHDGRDNGSEPLHRAMRQHFGEASAAVHAVYGSESPAHELAAFAPQVALVALDGDPVAREIWRQAGVHLADAAQAASHGLPANFSWGGRLFDAGELLVGAFRDELRRRVPKARLSEPEGQAADGALLLAQRGLTQDPSNPQPYAFEFPEPPRLGH